MAAIETKYSLSQLDINLDTKYDEIILSIIEKGVGEKITIEDIEYTIEKLEFMDDKIIDKYYYSKKIPKKEFEEKKEHLVNYGKDFIHKIRELILKSDSDIFLTFMRQIFDKYLSVKNWCFYLESPNKYIDERKFPHNINIGISGSKIFGDQTLHAYDTAHLDIYNISDLCDEIELPFNLKTNFSGTTVSLNLSHLIEFFVGKDEDGISKVTYIMKNHERSEIEIEEEVF